jgi:septum formation inhibitor-activating ATPase MinD
VTRMAELAATLLTREATLIVVDEHVVVETVLTCERRVAYETYERLDACHSQQANYSV